MKSEKLIVIGENFNSTRKIKATNPRVVEEDGKTGISYTDLDSMKVFFEKTRAMDVTRKDNFEITFPEFYELIKDYE